MALILLIETATTNCSVALHGDGEVIGLREQSAEQFVHAESLHVFIREMIQSCGIGMKDLQAVAVSQGPGSYTGLRIGISAAKGLCFALEIPLIAIDTLDALATDAQKEKPDAEIIIPMIDARRMEVYCSVYTGELKRLHGPSSVIVDQPYFEQFGQQRIVLTGDGSAKFAEIISSTTTSLNKLPSASMLSDLASSKFSKGEFVDVAYFDPFYLKEYVPGVAKKSVL
ncbi:MAG: tRNA (adenosine(37)-N6)-threonylcarbamoyltransferase complex dimerization subunit type 1 TsaB [Flavobacteriales bacterium]|nr:tRNA (adenosine(37)-N6)-threonylcarbamoyltransferase complex dimerization subunit type 1 TsaB [Flavobacteriales bacterium]